MVSKKKKIKAKGKGGRNKRSIMADVFHWREAGESEQEIRDKLSASLLHAASLLHEESFAGSSRHHFANWHLPFPFRRMQRNC